MEILDSKFKMVEENNEAFNVIDLNSNQFVL